jgi:2-iminobutanoate/2-iminopropanoate deaminase
MKKRRISMKKVISTDKAPAAIGPYSQAIEVNGMVYTSGIIPVVPETGEIPEGSVAQAKQAFTNLSHLLEAAGSSMGQVVKTTVFIKEMNDFGAINEVYQTFFPEPYPSRSCVEVARLPKDVMLEIEAIATK